MIEDWNLENWVNFWNHIEIDCLMDLYDKPFPTLILYSSDLVEGEKA